jgi:hypothetical protein
MFVRRDTRPIRVAQCVSSMGCKVRGPACLGSAIEDAMLVGVGDIADRILTMYCVLCIAVMMEGCGDTVILKW